MKILKSVRVGVLILTIVFAQVSFAKEKPIPPTVPVPPSEIPSSIAINPASLRHQLLETSLPLMQAFNAVKDAKIGVDKARTGLMPSLNVSAILTGGFAQAISFLLPFLAPTNWANLKAAKNNFDAEKLAYYTMELNIYSQALALYLSVNNDNEVQKTYDSEASDLEFFLKQCEIPVRIGAMQDSDLNQTRFDAYTAAGSASQLKQTLIGENESMKQMLGLPNSNVTYDDYNIPASIYENMNSSQIVDMALDKAPERKQIQFLVDAAGNNVWGAAFQFMNAGTYGNSPTSSSMQFGLNINIGFGEFPAIAQAQQNKKEIELLKTNLLQSNKNAVTTAMASLVEAKIQYDDFAKAELNMQNTYTNTIIQYRVGAMPLYYVMLVRAQIATATVNRLRSELNLNMQRLVIERSLILDQFGEIKGCNATKMPNPKAKISLDQLCRQITP